MASNISEYQDSLEDKVATRTEALENALTEVKKINRELIRTQDQLIESEKMSQTGLLVAGVAHEVNTPIGICVTATSVLEEKVKLLARAYNDNELSRSVLTDFIKNAHNCLDILSKNTERAADLIHSFKSVSVDQSSDQKRHIEIRSYVDLTIRSLQKELERKQVHINLAGDLSLTIETYPGAISQILSNLILNSLKHGFKHDQTAPRQINIGFIISSSRELNITFKDNGQGVGAESLPKLFEPFYTTSRQSGGSGLGLSIVYNLATQRLGGKINCHCESASGLIVVIEFPVNVIDG
jgi:signal transduction histidine kinase